MLAADNEGITILGEGIITGKPLFTLSERSLVPGAPGERPKRGCSEVHLGKFHDGRWFLATIEPWHGTDVVVWPESEAGFVPIRYANGRSTRPWPRAMLSGLPTSMAMAMTRSSRVIGASDHRVSMYDFDRISGKWARTVLDREIAAQDLRGGDLDGDGMPDVVAVGGAAHNVVWYHPRRP